MLTTAADMYRYVRIGIDKSASATVSPSEFEVHINTSMMDWVKQRYGLYDKNEQARNDLRVLTVLVTIANSGTNTPGGEIFLLPYLQSPPAGTSNGFLFALNVGLKMPNSKCQPASGWASARPLPRDSSYAIQRSPWSKATDEEPYYSYTGNAMTVVTGGSFASDARVEYLRYPAPIGLNPVFQPELPGHVNQEICDMCIRKILEETESPRWQTNVQENQLKN